MDAQAVIAALRDRARKYVSLDTPEDADLGDMAIDIATGFLPVVGTAQAGRDFERARRDKDKLGMGLSSLAAIPVVGGVAKAANKARKGGQAGEEAVKVLRGPRAEALETARQNAVKMLGLPENNTAMDRAKAMGFGNDVYHGTTKNFPAFDTSKLGASGVDAAEGVFTANNPKIANEFTWSNGSQDGANVMPLILRTSDPVKASTVLDGTTGSAAARVLQQAKRAGYDRVDFPTNMLGAEGTTQVVFDPSRIRSRFAAFDPARVNENDLLGRADPRLLAAIAAGGLGTAAAVSALRNRNKEEEKAAP